MKSKDIHAAHIYTLPANHASLSLFGVEVQCVYFLEYSYGPRTLYNSSVPHPTTPHGRLHPFNLATMMLCDSNNTATSLIVEKSILLLCMYLCVRGSSSRTQGDPIPT